MELAKDRFVPRPSTKNVVVFPFRGPMNESASSREWVVATFGTA
jgi:hypothetical protein